VEFEKNFLTERNLLTREHIIRLYINRALRLRQ